VGVLQDRVALVTGGSSGIGLAAAHVFAREGARVVIAARGVQRGEEAAAAVRRTGAQATFVRADVSRNDDVEALIEQVVAVHGRLDIAFNNAATTDGAFSFTADFTEEQFDRSIAMNLKSVWLCMKHEIRQMLAQEPEGGAIVNTSSVNGLGGAAGAAFYSACKAGVLALTKSASKEYATRGIRVNAIVAGAFLTPMLEHVFEKAGGGTPTGIAAVEAKYAELSAFNRIGRPEEAAEAALWLASDGRGS
jgi:NAD(P)-dependent dehydrogenase (short-subunit alcohol dehydrogenase family)